MSFLISIVSFACEDEPKTTPKIFVEKWSQGEGADGVTVYYPSESEGVPVSSFTLNIEVSEETYITTDLMIRPMRDDFHGLEKKEYKVSYIYLSEEFYGAASVAVKYEPQLGEDEPLLGCMPLPEFHKLTSLVADNA